MKKTISSFERQGVSEIALAVKAPATKGRKRCSGRDESVTVQKAIRSPSKADIRALPGLRIGHLTQDKNAGKNN